MSTGDTGGGGHEAADKGEMCKAAPMPKGQATRHNPRESPQPVPLQKDHQTISAVPSRPSLEISSGLSTPANPHPRNPKEDDDSTQKKGRRGSGEGSRVYRK